MRTGTITKCQYGQYEHGIPRHAGGSTFRRSDLWTSSSDGRQERDLLFAAHSEDDSPIQLGGYDANCPCCWLNFSHTQEKHAQSIAAHNAAVARHVEANAHV